MESEIKHRSSRNKFKSTHTDTRGDKTDAFDWQKDPPVVIISGQTGK